MPTATSDQAAGRDDLDNLLDYDGAVEDFWKDLPETNAGNANDTAQPEMDMDEEVKVTKKRKPNPKLDQELYVWYRVIAQGVMTDTIQAFYRTQAYPNSAALRKTSSSSKARETSSPTSHACSTSINCG